jgi:hypothetical protein
MKNQTGHADSVNPENKSKVVLNVILKFFRMRAFVRSVLINKENKSLVRIKMVFNVRNADMKQKRFNQI